MTKSITKGIKMGKENFRNKLCGCNSGIKFKRCCLFRQQGWTETATGWISQEEVQRRRMASSVEGAVK